MQRIEVGVVRMRDDRDVQTGSQATYPDMKPGEFYTNFRLLGQIRLRQVGFVCAF